jgi:hypothetical protein
VTDRTIAEKQRMTVSVSGGTREVDVPRFLLYLLQCRPITTLK